TVRETAPGRWVARCPAHDDYNPSLSIRDAGEKLLIHCFAGCSPLDIVHALGLELSDLFADPRRTGEATHLRRSTSGRIPARDVLVALDHEAHVVAMIAADVHRGRAINQESWDRLALAVSRIGN